MGGKPGQPLSVVVVTLGTMGLAPGYGPGEAGPEPALQPSLGMTTLQLSPGRGGLCVTATQRQD